MLKTLNYNVKENYITTVADYSYSILAQIPDYYSSIDFNLDGTSVRVQLSNLIINTHHTFIPYTSSSTDTWDIIRDSDLEFENSENVLLIYGYDDDDGMFISDRTRNKYDTCHTSSCIGLWNREHVFARSLASPSLTTLNQALEQMFITYAPLIHKKHSKKQWAIY